MNNFHDPLPPKLRRQRGDLIDELYETCSGGIGAPWHNQGCSRSPGPTRKRAYAHQVLSRPLCRQRASMIRQFHLPMVGCAPVGNSYESPRNASAAVTEMRDFNPKPE